MSNVQSKAINITIPEELLRQVDALAVRDYTSRSDIIRQALLDRVRQSKKELDEWGDPVSESWKTMVDFRKIQDAGVPIDDVIKAMEELVAERKGASDGGQSKEVSLKTTT